MPKIKINLLFAKNVMYQAATMISFNTTINVPAATARARDTDRQRNVHAPRRARSFSR